MPYDVPHLTLEQRHALTICMQPDGCWLVTKDSNSDHLLRGWQDRGWAKQVDASSKSLVLYQLTPAGRVALRRFAFTGQQAEPVDASELDWRQIAKAIDGWSEKGNH